MNIKFDIPESFYEAEERWGYSVSPDVKQLWAVELDLIREFSRVCEKHNLKWYAGFGTLLGAARHKGFIPWDDDVDILMMRNDYEYFCGIAKDEFQMPYRLWTIENNNSFLLHAKLMNESTTLIETKVLNFMNSLPNENFNIPQGIFIDIFPIDDVPDSDDELKKQYDRIRTYYRKWSKIRFHTYMYRQPADLLRRIKRTVQHYLYSALNITYMPYLMKELEAVKSFRNPNTKRIGFTCWSRWTKGIEDFTARFVWKRSDFGRTTYLPFEMIELPAPSEYEKILEQCYGNWREPEITHVHNTFFDAERPYTFYMNQKRPLTLERLNELKKQ